MNDLKLASQLVSGGFMTFFKAVLCYESEPWHLIDRLSRFQQELITRQEHSFVGPISMRVA